MKWETEYAFPVASALLAGFLIFHLSTERADAAAAAGGAAHVDTAALAAIQLPIAITTPLADEHPDDGVRLEYNGVFTLSGRGLRYSAPMGLSFDFLHPARLDSSFVGGAVVEAATLVLAEPAPYGWRIAKAGQRLQMVGPLAPYSSGFRRGGSELNRPDTLWIDGIRALDLVGLWPVVVHELAIRDPETDELTHIQVFSRGDPSTFEALVTPKPWEVGRTP